METVEVEEQWAGTNGLQVSIEGRKVLLCVWFGRKLSAIGPSEGNIRPAFSVGQQEENVKLHT